jgi:hypothetical protein
VIKPFAKKPQLPANYEEVSWSKLQLAVKAVANRRALEGGVGLEELYQCVENLCLHKLARRLYSRLRDECERHISRAVDALASTTTTSATTTATAATSTTTPTVTTTGGPFSSHSSSSPSSMSLLLQQPDALFLSRLEVLWFDHVDCANTLRAIFLVLDRSAVAVGGGGGGTPPSSSASSSYSAAGKHSASSSSPPGGGGGSGGGGGAGATVNKLPVVDLCLELLRNNLMRRPEVSNQS